MALEPEKVSHYRLHAKLGEGGMGAVYRAEDLRLGRHVALKMLPPALARDPGARARFLAEARAVSALEHPYICMLYEFDEHEGRPFLAMQLVDGETLAAAIARGPLEEARVREIVTAVASALAAAHARGIVHRDVKSENILIGRDGSIKLTDFGIARLLEGSRLTTAHGIVGTVAYMSPEQVNGGSTGPASDQFSLGIVAYECLTGTVPFRTPTPTATMYQIVNQPAVPPSGLRAGLSVQWDHVLERAMAKLPDQRFDSMLDFAQAVAGCGATGTTAEVRSSPATPAHSVAVLYFDNYSQDLDSDYFCAGITEDIVTDLSKLPGLRIASRNAVARYRGKTVDAREVARELGVAAVVLGNVRRAGNRVRITAQLVNGGDGFQMWAERYDRTIEDTFAVQDDIARAIVGALRGTLSADEAAEMRRTRPVEVEAYDLYLRGRELYRRYTHDDNRRALECFERAVRVEPHYALAWSGIADCCCQMVDRAWDADPSWQQRGLDAARRAIDLDPRLPEGHKAEALVRRTLRDNDGAMAALRRALACDPRFIPALINVAQEHLVAGDFAAAERSLRRAVAVDPRYGLGHLLLALVLLYTRRTTAAIESCHRAQSEGESPFYSTFVYVMRAHAFIAQGNFEAAQLELVGARAARVPPGIATAGEALLAARSGRADRALRLLVALEREAPRESYGCEVAASAAGALGDVALATHFLRAAESIDQRHVAAWRLNPDLRPVRDASEFRELVGLRGRSLVWPVEAPALAAEERALFADYAEASGLEAEE